MIWITALLINGIAFANLDQDLLSSILSIATHTASIANKIALREPSKNTSDDGIQDDLPDLDFQVEDTHLVGPHEIKGIDSRNPMDLSKYARSLRKDSVQEINLADPLRMISGLTSGEGASDLQVLVRKTLTPIFQVLDKTFSVNRQLTENKSIHSGVESIGETSDAENIIADDKKFPRRSLIGSLLPRILAAGPDDRLVENFPCVLYGMKTVGDEDLIVRADSHKSCQELCQKNNNCHYWTLMSAKRLCYHFSSIETVSEMKNAISGPRYCDSSIVSNNEPSQSGGYESSVKEESYEENSMANARHPESLVGEGLLSGLLSSLGNVGGMLDGGLNLGQTVSAASNIVTTGSQIMNAVPIKELLEIGKVLNVAGPGHGNRLRKNSTGEPTQPPANLSRPTVVCHNEGMTCCIPRINEWQRHTPYLNSYSKSSACKAIYVSSEDKLCVTSVYKGKTDSERCGVMKRDTEKFKLYRNILTVPQRDINNAICDCVVRKSDDDSGEDVLQGNARWEYRLEKEVDQTASDDVESDSRSGDRRGSRHLFQNLLSSLDSTSSDSKPMDLLKLFTGLLKQ